MECGARSAKSLTVASIALTILLAACGLAACGGDGDSETVRPRAQMDYKNQQLFVFFDEESNFRASHETDTDGLCFGRLQLVDETDPDVKLTVWGYAVEVRKALLEPKAAKGLATSRAADIASNASSEGKDVDILRTGTMKVNLILSGFVEYALDGVRRIEIVVPARQCSYSIELEAPEELWPEKSPELLRLVHDIRIIDWRDLFPLGDPPTSLPSCAPGTSVGIGSDVW